VRAIAGRIGHLRALRLADLQAYVAWRRSEQRETLHPALG
jgi:hypothetical protein